MFWSQSFDPAKDLADLSGKVIVVTGANTGLGYFTVKHLARKGAKVYLGARSEEKAFLAIQQLEEEGIGPGKVVWLYCDISTPELAKKSAETFLGLEDRLDVLVNNAGCTYDKTGELAKDGITHMMMINHVGTFQFTTTLLPCLIKTSEEPNSDVRIVTVTSDGHCRGSASNPNLKFDSLHEFKNEYAKETIPYFNRYFISKLANVLFTKSLQRRLSSTSIICLTLHPGVVNTSLSTHFRFQRAAHFLMNLLLKSPEEGAYTSCFSAGSPKVRESPETYKGAYLMPVGIIAKPSDNSEKVHLQDELWETTEKYLSGQL